MGPLSEGRGRPATWQEVSCFPALCLSFPTIQMQVWDYVYLVLPQILIKHLQHADLYFPGAQKSAGNKINILFLPSWSGLSWQGPKTSTLHVSNTDSQVHLPPHEWSQHHGPDARSAAPTACPKSQHISTAKSHHRKHDRTLDL